MAHPVLAGAGKCGKDVLNGVQPFTAQPITHRSSLSQLQSLGPASVPELESYLNALLQQLAEAAPVSIQGVRVFTTADGPSVAFADPPGGIYVSWRVVQNLQSDDEIAALLSHELAHIILRHSRSTDRSKASARLFNVLMLGGAATGVGLLPAAGAEVANHSVAAPLWSRAAESEADCFGTRLMARAGYNPFAMYTLIQMSSPEAPQKPSAIQSQKQGDRTTYTVNPGTALGNIFSGLGNSHPDPDLRLKAVSNLLDSEFPDAPANRYSRERFQQIVKSMENDAVARQLQLATGAYDAYTKEDRQGALAQLALLSGSVDQWTMPTRVMATWIWAGSGQPEAAARAAALGEGLLSEAATPLIFMSSPLMFADAQRDVPRAYALSRMIRERYDFDPVFFPLLLRSYARAAELATRQGQSAVANQINLDLMKMQADCATQQALRVDCAAKAN